MRGTNSVPKALLQETLTRKQISKTSRRTGLVVGTSRLVKAVVLEELEQTLTQYISTPQFHDLNREGSADGVKSAVLYLHSLGLAHNDINPDIIMVGWDEEAAG